MKKDKKSPRLKSQIDQLWEATVRLRILLFLLVVVALYGFIGVRIRSLTNAQPSSAEVASKASTTSKPYIDQSIVSQVKQLQDNSVTVQALFDQARDNPFRE